MTVTNRGVSLAFLGLCYKILLRKHKQGPSNLLTLQEDSTEEMSRCCNPRHREQCSAYARMCAYTTISNAVIQGTGSMWHVYTHVHAQLEHTVKNLDFFFLFGSAFERQEGRCPPPPPPPVFHPLPSNVSPELTH